MFGKLSKERKSNFYPSGQYLPAAALKSLLPAVRAMDTFIFGGGKRIKLVGKEGLSGGERNSAASRNVDEAE